MNSLKIIFVLSIILFSCKQKETENRPTIKVASTTSSETKKSDFISFFESIPNKGLPFTNNTLNKYIIFSEKYDYDATNKITSLAYDSLSMLKSISKFISKNNRYSYKPSDTSEYLKGDYFYPVNKFNKDSIYLIAYLYQDFEDIMPAVKTQLNSYDKNGNILDTLLLDNRFSFELIYKNDFIVEKDFSIKINKYIINYYDNLDNLIPKGSKPKESKKTYFYQINNYGVFERKIE